MSFTSSRFRSCPPAPRALLRAGEVIRQRDRARHHRGGDRQPHRRRLGEYRKEPRPAAAPPCPRRWQTCRCRWRVYRRPLSPCPGQGAPAPRPRHRRHADDLHPLGFVHVEEALHEVARAVDEALNRGIQVVADLLGEEKRRVFEVDEAAFRGGVALARLLVRAVFSCPALMATSCVRANSSLALTARSSVSRRRTSAMPMSLSVAMAEMPSSSIRDRPVINA